MIDKALAVKLDDASQADLLTETELCTNEDGSHYYKEKPQSPKRLVDGRPSGRKMSL